MSVKGKGARDKGGRAERKVRDMLRTIYPPELRKNVQRVPMSGAGYIKGDVADNNDVDFCYEVKNQETLCLPDWWRQAKSQAGATRTPVLVVTKNHYPYYFILRRHDWQTMVDFTEYSSFTHQVEVKSGQAVLDQLGELEPRDWGVFSLDDDDVVAVSQSFYLEVKTSLWYN